MDALSATSRSGIFRGKTGGRLKSVHSTLAKASGVPRDFRHTMNNSGLSEAQVGEILSGEAFLRERLHPRRRDFNFLCFTDLLGVIRPFADSVPKGGSVYDYGCGGAPYETLFAHCLEYVRADLVPGPKVQKRLRPDGLTEEPDGTYDAVLSTQVLEHVPDPLAYLRETLRILRPGGEALITTHGMFEEHGCRYDFHRWTIIGLERVVRQAGFEVVEMRKLTTQVRGAVQMVHYLVETLRLPGPRTPVWYLLDLARRIHRRAVRPVLNWAVDQFEGQGIVPGDGSAAVYVGISARVRRPR